MPTVKLTSKQLATLKVFMERTEMRGYEVRAFLEIANALTEASVEEGLANSLAQENKEVDAG